MQRFSLKIIIGLFFVCAVVLVFAQEGETLVGNTSSEKEASIVLSDPEKSLSLQTDIIKPESQDRSNFFILLQLIISLAVVCAGVYGFLYLIKRSKRFDAGTDPFLKNVASLSLSPDKTLYIVTLIDKAYLLGSSSSSLSLLAEITDKELIDAMNLHADQSAVPQKDFASLLYTFFPASKPKDSASSPLDSFLSKQRNRLQKNAEHYKEKETYEGENV